MEKKSQNNTNEDKSESIDKSMEESKSEKTGYEASDIIEDALQLAVDDELKEDREEVNSESGSTSKVNINSTHNEVNSQKYTEDSTPEQTSKADLSPKPDSAAVVVPMTIEDKLSMDSLKRSNGTDETSMIVNSDETQSDLIDGDIEVSKTNDSNDIKSNRKSINENNCNDSKSDSTNDYKNSINEDSKETKLSEKDSSKSKSSNQKESKIKSKESKNGSVSQKNQNSVIGRNIWVSGLSQSTKACELQTIFSKHGKVVSAKIIKNARMSGSRCYGFITMESSEQVVKCIAQLNKTELHGRTILLSRNRPQENAPKIGTRSKPNPTKKDVNKPFSKESEPKERKSEEKSDENKSKKSSEEKNPNKDVSESGSNRESETKSPEKRKPIRAPVRERPVFARRPVPMRRPIMPFRRPFPTNNPNIRGFHRPGFGRGGIRPNLAIKRLDVDRNIRERERERRLREERRRREEILHINYEREERIRLEREKERLKMERINLEREKAEFFKIERERAKLEREKIEREREELRRRQQSQSIIQHRIEDSRSRPNIMSVSSIKRTFDSREGRPTSDIFWDERKRSQNFNRIDTHLISGRQSFVESSSSVGNRHSIPHNYDNRNDSYKRNSRIELPMTGSSRTEFDARRQDSRHGMGHDRDDRKSSGGPTYFRGDSSRGSSFGSRDRRIDTRANSQRDDWKASHDSRRSDRYPDKQLSSGSNSFASNSRYQSDSRGWTDRSSNSVNKMSYGSSSSHISSGQQWPTSSRGGWNSAISSSESRSRGQPSLTSSMMSGVGPIGALFSSQPINSLQIPHSMGGSATNSLGSADRPYIHSNRRF